LLADLDAQDTPAERREHVRIELQVALNNLEVHVLEPMCCPECPDAARGIIEGFRRQLEALCALLETP
jgi:hypothetical protein